MAEEEVPTAFVIEVGDIREVQGPIEACYFVHVAGDLEQTADDLHPEEGEVCVEMQGEFGLERLCSSDTSGSDTLQGAEVKINTVLFIEKEDLEHLPGEPLLSGSNNEVKSKKLEDINSLPEKLDIGVVKEPKIVRKDRIGKDPTGPLETKFAVTTHKPRTPGSIWMKEDKKDSTEENGKDSNAKVNKRDKKPIKQKNRKGPIQFERRKYEDIREMFEKLSGRHNEKKDSEKEDDKG